MFAQQGFIQNFSVGVGKNVCIEPRPLGVCGVMLPQEIRNLHALRLLLGLQNGWKLATNELLSIEEKKSTSKFWGGELMLGDPSAPPLCMTPCTVQVMPRP